MLTIVRQASKADVPAICELQWRWVEEESVYGLTAQQPEQIEASLNSFFLVAEVGGRVVGFISASVHTSEGTAVVPAGERFLEIDDLYVEPDSRRRGIGGELVERALARAGEARVAYAVLYSAVKEIHSVLRFYERHDFRSWFVQMFRKL